VRAQAALLAAAQEEIVDETDLWVDNEQTSRVVGGLQAEEAAAQVPATSRRRAAAAGLWPQPFSG
jgi:hypothetical protein